VKATLFLVLGRVWLRFVWAAALPCVFKYLEVRPSLDRSPPDPSVEKTLGSRDLSRAHGYRPVCFGRAQPISNSQAARPPAKKSGDVNGTIIT